jgi:hypothetical protein
MQPSSTNDCSGRSSGSPPDIGKLLPPDSTDALSGQLRDLETRIADVDAAAPIVPARLTSQVETEPLTVVQLSEGLISRKDVDQ